jgi:hypothetical protein
MKSLTQGFLTGTRGQASAWTLQQVISPQFSLRLNTPRERSPLWGYFTGLRIQVSDTLKPHEVLFPGMQDRHPGLAFSRGGCSA